MKTVLVLLAALVPLAASAEEIPPVWSSTRCVYDRRAADGKFYELTLDRQKDGDFRLVTRAYVVPKGKQTGDYVTSLSEPMACARSHAEARHIACKGKSQTFQLLDFVRIDPVTDERTNELVAIVSEPEYRWAFSGDPAKKGPTVDHCEFR